MGVELPILPILSIHASVPSISESSMRLCVSRSASGSAGTETIDHSSSSARTSRMPPPCAGRVSTGSQLMDAACRKPLSHALRMRCANGSSSRNSNSATMPPSCRALDAQRPADGQPARRRASRRVVRPHHHRIAAVVVEPQSREVDLRSGARPVVCGNHHAAPPGVHRLAPHDGHAHRPHPSCPDHRNPRLLHNAKSPRNAGPSSATNSGASSPSA